MAELFAGAEQNQAKKQRTDPSSSTAKRPSSQLFLPASSTLKGSMGKTVNPHSPMLSTGVFEQAASSHETSRVVEDTSVGLGGSGAGPVSATAKFDRLSLQCSRTGANTPGAG